MTKMATPYPAAIYAPQGNSDAKFLTHLHPVGNPARKSLYAALAEDRPRPAANNGSSH